MTKKERENKNMMAWKMARSYERAEKKGASRDYLEGMWRVMTTFQLMSDDIDFTDMLIAIEQGKYYRDYFGGEYAPINMKKN